MVANKKASHDERLAKGLSTLIFQGDSHKPRSAGFGTCHWAVAEVSTGRFPPPLSMSIRLLSNQLPEG